MNSHENLIFYSTERGLSSSVGQWLSLARHHRLSLDSRVANAVAELEEIEREIFENTGARIKDCRVLDVGPGQQLLQMAYFASRGNPVVGVDRDLIVQGFNPVGYWRMARSNGLSRALKTIGRRALGIDRRYRRELRCRLEATKRLPQLQVLQRNAWDTGLRSGSFDLVYSLAPVTNYRRGHISGPAYEHLVEPSAHLNRMSLAQWRDLVSHVMPDSKLRSVHAEDGSLRRSAEPLHRRGELTEFSIEDLLTSSLHVTWRKLRSMLVHVAIFSDDALDGLGRFVGWAAELAGAIPV